LELTWFTKEAKLRGELTLAVEAKRGKLTPAGETSENSKGLTHPGITSRESNNPEFAAEVSD
jgi:hypothetical protein